MLNKILFSLLLLSFCCCLSLKASVQDSVILKKEIRYDQGPVEPISFEQEELQEYRQDKAFNYVEADSPDNAWTRFKTWLNDLYNSFINWILQGEEAGGLLAIFIESLPYLILFGVLVFLVWIFARIDLGGSPPVTGRPGQVILSDEQEILETKNIQELIDQALASANYRLAIRYYYLSVLQQLSEKELIDWEVQKTNMEYIYELKNDSLRNQFSRVTRLYDFIWYGNFDVNSETFKKAEKEFINLKRDL